MEQWVSESGTQEGGWLYLGPSFLPLSGSVLPWHLVGLAAPLP